MIPNPRLVIEYWTNNAGTFGRNVLDGMIHDASEVGWSWYSRYPSNCFFTLPQSSAHNARLNPLLTHVQVTYVNDATGFSKVVFTGRLSEPDESGEDVIWTAWSYLSELALSRTGYRTLYPNATLSSIVSAEWTLAKAQTYTLMGHIATGTIETPKGVDGTTDITTDTRFGVLDVPRLLLFFDLSEIGRANTINNVVFEITRETPFTFNFWKNKGSAIAGRRLTFPGIIRDYRFVPGFATLRNDLATIGTTAGGGASEIVRTNEASAAQYGRRQDVFTIKTLAGLASGTTESDAQIAITERAVKEASQLARNLAVEVRHDQFEPFDGFELEDTFRVQIAQGRTAIDADYRLVGLRGTLNASGYTPQVLLQLPTAA